MIKFQWYLELVCHEILYHQAVQSLDSRKESRSKNHDKTIIRIMIQCGESYHVQPKKVYDLLLVGCSHNSHKPGEP